MKPEPTHSSARDLLWASALRAAAAFARRAAFTEEDVIRAVTEELRRLKLSGTVALLRSDGMLQVVSRGISPSAASSIERLTGLTLVGFRFDPDQVDLYRQALHSRRAVYASDHTTVLDQLSSPSRKPLLPRVLRLLGHTPVIVAPLMLADETLGALHVTGRWLTAEDAPMVEALADHAAISLGHARAHTEMQAALARERLRNQVAETIASNLDLPLVLERVLRLAADVSNADAGTIALLSDEGDSLEFVYLFNLPDSLHQSRVPPGQGLSWRVIEGRQAIVIPDYLQAPFAIPEWVRAGIRSALAVPLIAGEDIVGGLGLFTLHEARGFDKEQVEMVQAVARMAAVAIKNSRSFSEARRRAEESQALIRSAGAISASLDLQTVLTQIAEQARSLFRADGSRIHLLDPERNVLRCLVAIQPDAEAIKAIELRPGQGLTGHVLETGQPLIVNDAPRDSRGFHVPGTPVEDPEVMMLAPLTIRQRTMGVMTVLRFSYDRPFAAADLELLNPFAVHAALAIENAHLYGQIEQQAQRLEAEVIERTRDLALSEARYRALVETSLAGIFQTDPQGRIVYANQALADMLELHPDDLIGTPDLRLGIAPEQADILLQHLTAKLRGERAKWEAYDVTIQSRSGRRIPALLAVSLIADGQGELQGITGLVLDISERKALEAALRAERDRLHAILTNIGDAVVVTNPQGVIEYVNPAWELLNGYPADEAVGQTPRLTRSGQQSPEFYADLWRTILSGQTWTGEVINRRKDGSLYDAALTITPIKDETGGLVSFVGVQHDISALKELDRMKSQFVSDVSHELRTPLTNIRLYLDLLRAVREPTKTSQYLETMDRESTRLANLIDDLLSLSRLDVGTVSVNLRPVDINALLTALVEDRRVLAATRGLTLRLECDLSVPPVPGDDRLLTQVFTNLLTNALNYTRSGGTVTLRTRLESGDGGWAAAEVEDTGLGIPLEEQGQIFRRFFRGRASRETGAAGTGLGLAICKEIVDRHGGRIDVVSDGIPGRGSRFTVRLPCQPAPSTPPQPSL